MDWIGYWIGYWFGYWIEYWIGSDIGLNIRLDWDWIGHWIEYWIGIGLYIGLNIGLGLDWDWDWIGHWIGIGDETRRIPSIGKRCCRQASLMAAPRSTRQPINQQNRPRWAEPPTPNQSKHQTKRRINSIVVHLEKCRRSPPHNTITRAKNTKGVATPTTLSTLTTFSH